MATTGISYLIRYYAPLYMLIYLYASVVFTIIISLIFINRLKTFSEDVSAPEEMKIYDEEKLEERIETILNHANLLFNRLENTIFSLKSRASTVLAILIATVTFIYFVITNSSLN